MSDVLIIGAGPAGLAAAIACAENNLAVRIVDEFVRPGGRLLGQLHEEPDGTWWNGIEQAQRLHENAVKLGVQIDCGVSVYNLERIASGWRVYTTAEIIEVPVVLLATGASETAIPVPGWTLPGVMSIGAAQVMTNVHRVCVGLKGIVIGVNILSMAITRELQMAGVPVEAVLLPATSAVTLDAAHPHQVMQSLLRAAHFAPSRLIRFGSKFMKYSLLRTIGIQLYPKAGLKMWGIPVHLRKAVLEIYGDTQVEGVVAADVTATGEIVAGSEHKISADFVCIAGGLSPLVELAAVAGCPFRYIPELGGHVPLHNEKMKTPLPGLYVSGNITGIESAQVAIAQGVVAGLSISEYCAATDAKISEQLLNAISNVQSVRTSAVIQFHPNTVKGRNQMQQAWYEQSIAAHTDPTLSI